jgi:dCTP deaminase
MILTGLEIARQVELGNITIDPYEPKNLNPASIDLTLGNKVALYENYATCDAADRWDPLTLGKPFDGTNIRPFNSYIVYDLKSPLKVREFTIDPKQGWILQPGVGYLMHTAERVFTQKFVPVLDGKSSIGRLFIKVHETAGYGDINFNGQYTLEVTSMYPVRVYPGMRFCQMRFHAVQGEVNLYNGNYTGPDAMGPVASKAWKQFK